MNACDSLYAYTQFVYTDRGRERRRACSLVRKEGMMDRRSTSVRWNNYLIIEVVSLKELKIEKGRWPIAS